MTPFEVDECMKTFTIISDTREQQTDRTKWRYESMGVPVRRATLSYGDYCGNVLLPSGNWMYDETSTITPKCIVERKFALDELASCFTHGRDRFQREFQRAIDNQARIFLLVENANWENLLNGKYRSKFHPNAFAASLESWMMKYNINLIFCKEETSGRLIKDLLYREMKHRLEMMVDGT